MGQLAQVQVAPAARPEPGHCNPPHLTLHTVCQVLQVHLLHYIVSATSAL